MDVLSALLAARLVPVVVLDYAGDPDGLGEAYPYGPFLPGVRGRREVHRASWSSPGVRVAYI